MKTALIILMTASPVFGSGLSVVVPRFEAAVKEEMREWEIGGIATAWVDGARVGGIL